jgi:hypothetical protein
MEIYFNLHFVFVIFFAKINIFLINTKCYVKYYLHSTNKALCVFLDMGYDDIFETRISGINKETHPEKQVFINVYLRRKQ